MLVLPRPEIPRVNLPAASGLHNRLALWSAMLLIIALFRFSAAEAANQRPVADAGSDRAVALSATVRLDGSQSFDPDGRINKYRWRQTKGPSVKLAQARTAAPFFTTPARLRKKAASAQWVFKLTVTDDKKASASDTVVISYAGLPSCNPPQVLQDGVCVTPPPACRLPQVLRDGLCITPPPVCVLPRVLQNGICVTPPPVCMFPQVLKNGACITPVPDCELPKVSHHGVCVTPTLTPKFNDTGVTRCSDTNFTGVDCPLSLYPGQDAEAGRDVTHYNDGDGRAGFSFSKIDASGAELAPGSTQWSCVKDHVTGLIWEVKTDDGGLRDKDSLYTNFSPAYNPNGQYGGAGDASGLVDAVNAQRLCGAGDWRLPTVKELQGIVDYGVGLPGPTIESAFFPNTPGSAFWSSSAHARDAKGGWVVYFDDGRVFDDERALGFRVRLVRSGP